MTSSGEKIVLQVPQVSYKKIMGTLFLMDQRFVWKAENEGIDDVPIAHLYCDIKSQSVTPKNKTNARMKIVLHNNKGWCIFHFLNSGGVKDQRKDVVRVKQLLFKLSIKCKEQMEKTLKDKEKFLASHPDRLRLYKDLVVSKIITSQEFWLNQAAICDWVEEVQPQEIGVSSGFLSEIKQPEAGGFNYRMTLDAIESIFKVYPSIKNLHKKNVPVKLTEENFWLEFVLSGYYQKNPKYSESDNLFTECSKIDDEKMKKALLNEIEDPLLDIDLFEDKCPVECSNSNSKLLIGRINRESIMVCKLNNQTERSGSEKHENEEQLSHMNNNVETTLPLNLTKIERFCIPRPTPKVEVEERIDLSVRNSTTQKYWKQFWRIHSSSIFSPEDISEASEALGEYTLQVKTVKSRQKVPNLVEKAVKNLYRILCELLSQFWKCFPATTPELEEKALRMHAALTRFQSIKLKPFEDKLEKISSPWANNLTKHLHQLIETADRKLSNWQNN